MPNLAQVDPLTPQLSNEQVIERLQADRMVEGPQHASEDYIKALTRTLIVSADTELISAPSYLGAAADAPDTSSYMSVISIVQDELGHAHIAYRMLRDLGVDVDELVYGRSPGEFKYPYAFDVPLESWPEMIVANAFYDRAGFVLLSDVFDHTSYVPWKRALVKVDREETFHLRHGERWIAKLARDEDWHRRIQAAMDWMFVLTLEWFGLPDDLKKHGGQLSYGLKGQTNDQLRQTWMSATVPFAEKHDFDVPAHLDEESGEYVIDCAFPMAFDPEKKEWDHGKGEVSWDDVIDRWRAKGPANERFVTSLQRGHAALAGAA
ncbi:Phenylacetic acid catabolic protein [Salsipaludibacter albus]|uniref:Phenylacetic acid catabolic protein n=1 Tax=Salsipaludibacter albus TaxID=2849650 RepID=UPI0030842392